MRHRKDFIRRAIASRDGPFDDYVCTRCGESTAWNDALRDIPDSLFCTSCNPDHPFLYCWWRDMNGDIVPRGPPRS